MEGIVALLALAALGVAAAYVTWLDIAFERREIERYLRLGGARILRFRWKPFIGLFGIDKKSKHYRVDYEEHTGRRLTAIFTYTTGVGVMMSERKELPDN